MQHLQKTRGRVSILPLLFNILTFQRSDGSSIYPLSFPILAHSLAPRALCNSLGVNSLRSLSIIPGCTPSLRPPEFRILFQVPYPASPLFATLTKTAVVVWVLAEISSRKARSPSHS